MLGLCHGEDFTCKRESEMTIKRIVHGAAAAALVAGVTMFGAAAPASAACKSHWHERFAVGAFQTPTEILARSKWRNAVRSHDGVNWTRWSRAKDKTMRCHKIQPGNRWHCLARARPCNT